MKKLIAFLALSICMVCGAYITFHYIYKSGVYNEWYEYFCYCACVIGSAYHVYGFNEDK